MKVHNGNTLSSDRAAILGWDHSQIQILDGDLGKSGQTTAGREDFHRLMAAVGLGEVGAVFALEASRFSRSQADWHKLIDICALTDTLVIDHDGIYDPNDFNDRVLLGFKGTWSHTELHGMRLRLQGAKLNKAKKGELRCAPPTGYVYDPEGKLVFDPDESVVAAIRLVFQQFRLLGTAFKVMRYESPKPDSQRSACGLAFPDHHHTRAQRNAGITGQAGGAQPRRRAPADKPTLPFFGILVPLLISWLAAPTANKSWEHH